EGSLSGVAVSEHVTGPYRFIKSFRPNAGVWPENISGKAPTFSLSSSGGEGPAAQKRRLSADETDYVNSLELVGGPVPYYPKHLLFRRDFAGGQMARDMTLFVDEDGAAYHIYASEANGTLQFSMLSDDYLAPARKFVRVFPGRFHEAPALMKW